MKKESINYHADFVVRAKSFEVYESFVNIANKLGVPYNTNFNKFEPAKINVTNCLYFSKIWSCIVGKACALSNWSRENKSYMSYDLETQFGEALDHLKTWTSVATYKNEMMKLTAEYSAIVNYHTQIVTVGCQEIPFETVETLYQLTKKHSS
jgi:hypothetical protein